MKELIFFRTKKGEGDIPEKARGEMQRACGYGGPHVETDLSTLRTLCRKWGTQAVEARVRGAGLDTPLITAIKYGHSMVALELIEAKWDREDETTTIPEWTQEVMDDLLKRRLMNRPRADVRANVHAVGVFLWTPLHFAAREALLGVVGALVARVETEVAEVGKGEAEVRKEKAEKVKSYVNAADPKGRTPLWLAIFNAVVDTECREKCGWYKRAKDVMRLLVQKEACILTVINCPESRPDFKEKLFMEFQLDDDTEPTKHFFNFLKELATEFKQQPAADRLDEMLKEEEPDPKAKGNNRNQRG